jgi:hypothetical protein
MSESLSSDAVNLDGTLDGAARGGEDLVAASASHLPTEAVTTATANPGDEVIAVEMAAASGPLPQAESAAPSETFAESIVAGAVSMPAVPAAIVAEAVAVREEAVQADGPAAAIEAAVAGPDLSEFASEPAISAEPEAIPGSIEAQAVAPAMDLAPEQIVLASVSGALAPTGAIVEPAVAAEEIAAPTPVILERDEVITTADGQPIAAQSIVAEVVPVAMADATSAEAAAAPVSEAAVTQSSNTGMRTLLIALVILALLVVGAIALFELGGLHALGM